MARYVALGAKQTLKHVDGWDSRSIDNDAYGTEKPSGSTTAVNTAIGGNRQNQGTPPMLMNDFCCRVMGRSRGVFGVNGGLTGWRRGDFVPEVPYTIENIVHRWRLTATRVPVQHFVAAEGIGDTHS
jgi:6-phosphofructokinase